MRSQRHERIRNCPVCQKEFVPEASNAAKGWGICCSKDCRIRYRMILKEQNLEQTFWAKVHKTDGCWIWTGSQLKDKHGMAYGEFVYGKLIKDKISKKRVRAHRFAWELINGPVPEGMCVLHNCPDGDNSLCCRPEHLWLGTRSENTLDMHAKGRYVQGPHPSGENLPQSKLSAEKVHEIDRLYSLGWTTAQIGYKFDVSDVCICNVINRKTWKQVPKLI